MLFSHIVCGGQPKRGGDALLAEQKVKGERAGAAPGVRCLACVPYIPCIGA